MCFSYSSTETITKTSNISIQSSAHHIRSLVQTFYNLESTRRRYLEQVVPKTDLFPKNHIVCVPRLWAVISNPRMSCFNLVALKASAKIKRKSTRMVIISALVLPFQAAKHSLKILDSQTPNSFFSLCYTCQRFSSADLLPSHGALRNLVCMVLIFQPRFLELELTRQS